MLKPAPLKKLIISLWIKILKVSGVKAFLAKHIFGYIYSNILEPLYYRLKSSLELLKQKQINKKETNELKNAETKEDADKAFRNLG